MNNSIIPTLSLTNPRQITFASIICLGVFSLNMHANQGGDDTGGGTNQTDPALIDTDEDGLTDHDETHYDRTDPNNSDSDGDGLTDGEEAIPNDDFFTFDRTQGQFIVVDLGAFGEHDFLSKVNNQGDVAIVLDTSDEDDEFKIKSLDGTERTIQRRFIDLNNKGESLSYEKNIAKVYIENGSPVKNLTLSEFPDVFDTNESREELREENDCPEPHSYYLYSIRSGLTISGTLDDETMTYLNVSASFNYSRSEGERGWSQSCELDSTIQGFNEYREDLSFRASYIKDQLVSNSTITDNDNGLVSSIVNPEDYNDGNYYDWGYTMQYTTENPFQGTQLIRANHAGDYLKESGTWKIAGAFEKPYERTFSDGVTQEIKSGTVSYNIYAFNELNGQEGLWKSWTKYNEEPVLSLALGEDGSPLNDQQSGNTVTVKQMGSNGLMIVEQNDNDFLWRNGRALTESNILGRNSEWSGLKIKQLSDSGSIIGGLATKDGQEHVVILMAAKMEYVNRDDPEKNYANGKDRATVGAGTRVIYAGNVDVQDHVAFKIDDDIADNINASNYAWSAEPLSGFNHLDTIQGASGADKNEWVLDGNNGELDWKPGKYKIKCDITVGGQTISIEFEQEVGWRTDDYLIIGQIKETNHWNLVASQKENLRRTIFWKMMEMGEDVTSFLFLPTLPQIAGESIPPSVEYEIVNGSASTEIFFQTYAGAVALLPWFYATNNQGPLESRTQNWFNINEIDLSTNNSQRMWAIQETLNDNSDELELQETISDGTELDIIRQNREFRIFSRYQAKLKVDKDRQIYEYENLQLVDQSGTTKLNIVLDKGEIYDNYGIVMPPADIHLPLPPSEPEVSPNTFNSTGTINEADDGSSISMYSSYRIADKGQKLHWTFFGLAAPWIFTETIFKVKDDGSIDTELRASTEFEHGTNVVMDANAQITSGSCVFNQISVYRLKQFESTEIYYEFDRLDVHSMEENLECFITSGENALPGAPTQAVTE